MSTSPLVPGRSARHCSLRVLGLITVPGLLATFWVTTTYRSAVGPVSMDHAAWVLDGSSLWRPETSWGGAPGPAPATNMTATEKPESPLHGDDRSSRPSQDTAADTTVYISITPLRHRPPGLGHFTSTGPPVDLQVTSKATSRNDSHNHTEHNEISSNNTVKNIEISSIKNDIGSREISSNYSDSASRNASGSTTASTRRGPTVMPVTHGYPLNVTDARPPKRLLLLTHYRGGSTFLGDLFNQNPKMIYWFEPLHGYQRPIDVEAAKKPKEVAERNFYWEQDHIVEMPLEAYSNELAAMDHVLHCDSAQIDSLVLMDARMKTGRARKVAEYVKCLTPLAGENLQTRVRRCRPTLQRLCRAASVIVVKTIRMSPFIAEVLLERDPELKVVYYTRDPRGSTLSRAELTAKYRRDLVRSAVAMCLAQELNFRKVRELQSQYPDRVLWLRYEDLALNPEVHARKLYDFIQEEMPQDVLTWIRNNTESPKPNGAHGTRRNSSEVATSWQRSERYSAEVLNKISSACQKSFRHLGYPLR